MDPQLIMDIGGPPNPRKPVPNMGPEELLEHFKPQIMQTLGIEGNEEAWEEAIEGQAEVALAMSNMEGQVKSRDIWVRAPGTLSCMRISDMEGQARLRII